MKLKEAVKESSLIGMDRRPVVQLAAKAVAQALHAAQWATAALRSVVEGRDLAERKIPDPVSGVPCPVPGLPSTPMSATVIKGMKTVLALKASGPPSIREGVETRREFGGCSTASADAVAFGRMVDLLQAAMPSEGEANPGPVGMQRLARGVVLHQDDLHLYLALPGQTRVLVVDKADLAHCMLPSSTGMLSSSRATLRDSNWREVTIRFDASSAKPTAMAVGAKVGDVDLDDQHRLNCAKSNWLQPARACGMHEKASMLDQGKLAVVDLVGHRGKVLEGVVLGMTTD